MEEYGSENTVDGIAFDRVTNLPKMVIGASWVGT